MAHYDLLDVLDNLDEVDPRDEAMEDEFGASFGDPRRCPRHPHVATSSPDGMFDGLCHICEGEADEEADAWDRDPANPRRSQCGNEAPFISMFSLGTVSCFAGSEDEIPF